VSNDLSRKTQELITLAREGDRCALDQLFSVYGERIRRIIRLRMGKELRSKLESMDLVNEALMCAVRDLKEFSYRDEGDFLRWLAQIAENRIRDNLDRLHAGKRDIRKESPLDDDTSKGTNRHNRVQQLAMSTTPSAILSKKEELDKLENAIDQLKPEHREIILLAKIEGLSYKEVADKLNKSTDMVGYLLSQAMMALTQTFWKN
jgi:RNA polymerase sigma-70 factor (ECF subfamily)